VRGVGLHVHTTAHFLVTGQMKMVHNITQRNANWKVLRVCIYPPSEFFYTFYIALGKGNGLHEGDG